MLRPVSIALLAASTCCFSQTPRSAVWGGLANFEGADPLAIKNKPNPCVAADTSGVLYLGHRDVFGSRVLKWDSKVLQVAREGLGICDALVVANNALFSIRRSVFSDGIQILKYDLHTQTDVIVAGTTGLVVTATPSLDGPAQSTIIHPRIGAFAVDPRSGEVYFGADGPQIKKVSGGNITTIDSTINVRSIAVDGTGAVYAGSGTGIWKRQGSSFNLIAGKALAPCPTAEVDGPALSAVFCEAGPMVVDGKGDLYFLVNSTGGFKIKRLSGGSVTTILGGPDDPVVVVDRRVPGSLALAPGGFFIGDDSGVQKFDLTTRELKRVTGFTDVWCCEGKKVENVQFTDFFSGPGLIFNANGSGAVATSSQILTFNGNRTLKVLAGQLEPGPAFGPMPGDGPALSTRIFTTRVIALGNGEYVFCESSYHRVRKLTADGEIKTIAGNGTPGFSGDGGPAEKAMVNHPSGIALLSGRIYIADTENHRIRMIDADGKISTVAGTGVNGYNGENIPGPAAQMNRPADLEVLKGRIHINEPYNYRIRMIDSDGLVRTVTGSGGSTQHIGDGGPASQAKIFPANSIVADPSGNLYLLESSLCSVRKISVSGIISTVVGPGRCNDMTGPGPFLDSYSELSTDSAGNLYITYLGLIQKVSFSPPVLSLSRNVSRSGPVNARILTLLVANARVSGDAFDAHLSSVKVAQTEGEECSEPPKVTAIPASPNLGFLRSGNTGRVRVTVDFGACPVDAKFTVTGVVTAAGDYSQVLSATGVSR